MNTELDWCKKQKKGIRLAVPSGVLGEVYLKKSESALNMLVSAIEKNEPDWIASTMYYAKYFSVYALLAKCGIKCEIHDCTLKAMKLLFVDSGIISKELYEDIEDSKTLRVDLQYYTSNDNDAKRLSRLAGTAPDFVLLIKPVYERIGDKEVMAVRQMF
ncbi:MAG: HEPN domain-containing protein [Nanoarchaeota archaeon]